MAGFWAQADSAGSHHVLSRTARAATAITRELRSRTTLSIPTRRRRRRCRRRCRRRRRRRRRRCRRRRRRSRCAQRVAHWKRHANESYIHRWTLWRYLFRAVSRPGVGRLTSGYKAAPRENRTQTTNGANPARPRVRTARRRLIRGVFCRRR